MVTKTSGSKYKFEAEVDQVLDLVINSLYSNKDIFLRELISNSADAISKLRFEALTNKDLLGDGELGIFIAIDKEARTISIQDNGIGMSQDDLINNLGTIAKSGTKEFLEKIKAQNNSAELIGQFGVGFYSAFIVAAELSLETKKAGEDQGLVWTSTGTGEYEIQPKDDLDFRNGTKITLKLKEGKEFDEYLQDYKIRSIVKKYSDFIEFPIKFETIDDEKNETLWELMNSQKALWTKNKSEITDDEYNEFYKHLSHDFTNPIHHLHYNAEGTNEYTALLYFPQSAGMEMFMPDSQKGLQLYINKVFISSEPELLLPQYLRFVRGLVDSQDLPLNVSREILQQNPRVAAIKKNLGKKILSELEKLKKSKFDDYKKWYAQFGKIIKEGVHTDFANKDKIMSLLMFETTKTETGESISLQDYVDRNSSDEIYYITGDSRVNLENSPYLEALKAKDIEVVFMTDPIDEWVVSSGTDFKAKKFKSATKGDIKLDDDDKEVEAKTEEYKDLLTSFKDQLKDKVSDVKFSDRLVETVACLVANENDISANMERIYKNANQAIPKSKRVLELNSKHALITKLNALLESGEAQDYMNLIYDQALLLEGSAIEDMQNYNALVTKLMLK
ncbi:MAG: molecular chaperone HtpG [Cyanobacteria bacterium]|nr:molecular chaperone HtpG [Cyanobacteriota bacterium]MDA1020726.1 molecular chaperone HtpG [Cyanobacteriota bacterium]